MLLPYQDIRCSGGQSHARSLSQHEPLEPTDLYDLLVLVRGGVADVTGAPH